MKTYRISKIYVGYESKNRPNYQTGLTLDEAIKFLNTTEYVWRKNGGIIEERTEDTLTVQESDGSQTIIFSIIEEL